MRPYAILVPYAEYQNEPSEPLAFLWEVPDTQEQLVKEMTEIFFEHVLSIDDADPPELDFNEGDECFYGDFSVSDEHAGIHLFATYVEGYKES